MQGDIGHAALGLIALGILLIQLISISKANAHSPALWLVTAVTVVLDLSGWLAPYSTFHMGTTVAALVVHGELILKLLREAGIALGSESANGSCSMWVAV
jgi:hypothetical protein